MVNPQYEWIMLAYSILFLIQTVWMSYANLMLNRTLTATFETQHLNVERRFLKCTLIGFSVSYLFAVIRTLTIFLVLKCTDKYVL